VFEKKLVIQQFTDMVDYLRTENDELLAHKDRVGL